VQRGIDGDTVVLAGGARVRYIGIDTPERGEPFFDVATEYNRRLVEGKRVQLLKDESDTDRFGRLLRYVLAGDILVNAELVREGLADAKRYEPDVKFADCFDALMQEARENQRGIWEP
jgi:micrococcal nuclease